MTCKYQTLLALSVLTACSSTHLNSSEPNAIATKNESTCGNGHVDEGEHCDFRVGYVVSTTDGAKWVCNQLCDWEIDAVPKLTVLNGKQEERVEFNSQGQVVRKWDGAGNKKEYRYNSDGQKVVTFDFRGQEYSTVLFDYDDQGRLVRERSTFDDGSEDTIATYTYTNDGYTERRNNDVDNVFEETWVYQTDGQLLSYRYEKLFEIKYKYNKKRWLVSRTKVSLDGTQTRKDTKYKHDNRGNVVESIAHRSEGERRDVFRESTTYDARGHVTKRVEETPAHVTTSLASYDVGGRLVRLSRHNTEDPKYDGQFEFTYDQSVIELQRTRPKPRPGISFSDQSDERR